MEEDAGKSLHHGQPDSDRMTSLDFNRSGVPLIEIVTEPDLRSAADAAECFSRLREMLVTLGVNDGNMEEGSLRCDANVSVRPAGTAPFGTKAEVKNVNSFKYLQKALEYEIERQIDLVSQRRSRRAGDAPLGQRHGGDDVDAQQGRGARLPLLPRAGSAAARRGRRVGGAIRASLPELPEARKQRLIAAHGLTDYDADLLVRLITGGADYFEAVVAAGAPAKAASNWIQGELRRRLKDLGADDMAAMPCQPEALAELIDLTERNVISSTVAKDVFEKMWTSGARAQAIVDARRTGADGRYGGHRRRWWPRWSPAIPNRWRSIRPGARTSSGSWSGRSSRAARARRIRRS